MNGYIYPDTELLEPEEELQLGEKIQAGIKAQEILESANNLSAARRRKLRQEVAEGKKSQEHMVNANMGLVRKVVKKYSPHGCDQQDLIQEGSLGLMRAVEKFDPSRKLRFSTYAMAWIKQSVQRANFNAQSMLKIASPVLVKIQAMQRKHRDLCQELGREPTDEELAHWTNRTVAEIEQLRKWAEPTNSIDVPLRNDDYGGMTLGDTLADAHSDAMFEAAEKFGIEGVIDQIRSVLTSEEQEALQEHYLHDERLPRTVSKHSRHLLRRAKAKIRHPASDIALSAAPYLD